MSASAAKEMATPSVGTDKEAAAEVDIAAAQIRVLAQEEDRGSLCRDAEGGIRSARLPRPGAGVVEGQEVVWKGAVVKINAGTRAGRMKGIPRASN
jgi:hypothetical protein